MRVSYGAYCYIMIDGGIQTLGPLPIRKTKGQRSLWHSPASGAHSHLLCRKLQHSSITIYWNQLQYQTQPPDKGCAVWRWGEINFFLILDNSFKFTADRKWLDKGLLVLVPLYIKYLHWPVSFSYLSVDLML